MSEKRLKILFANIPTPGNRFVVDLKEGLEQYAEVTWDCNEFWKMEKDYDIIHIHWPEYLSFELESYLYKPEESIPKALWNKMIICLEYWSKNSKLIYTRHVQYPHARHDEEFLKLYKTVASYCKTVIHFANFSIQQFKQWYPDLDYIKHVVIPHHNYASLPSKSTKIEAREYLDIDSDAHVMLVFGSIKENEKPLIKKAFDAIPYRNKVLLAPGWKIQRQNIGYIRLREWVWKFEKWLASRNKTFRTNLGFVKEEEAHYYLNAADFLFIPRTNELNSGNITLGCTFGLVVVGKNTADIGELLKETGNPTFAVGDDESLKIAIEKAYQLKEANHGLKNKELALNEWNIQKIAKAYWEEMIDLNN
ncbi:MAG: glycosyltransferase [Flavobacteriaceae bacterium]|uniref:Glycosyl transferase family 1 domain-containing protein n=1 Tax=Phaeodactylibacter xiamenensis TaxID=1524460 RepID=A0A098S3A0_9BACT|nr:glycosyltransferase [Phaeodactylibacter xiamenensis]KGE86620.1 hypothetical protein IX84_20230 [Phaeodactylibacter xiamenensis]MCR9265868.1 glycosyltransferase [Flavobacteriaceae bacterium]